MKTFHYSCCAVHKDGQVSHVIGVANALNANALKAVLESHWVDDPNWIYKTVMVSEVCEDHLVDHTAELNKQYEKDIAEKLLLYLRKCRNQYSHEWDIFLGGEAGLNALRLWDSLKIVLKDKSEDR